MKTDVKNISNNIHENHNDLLPHLTYLDIEDIHSNYIEEENAHIEDISNSDNFNEVGRNFNDEYFI